MNKLILLKIEMAMGQAIDDIYPVVLCDDTNCVLVDCGYVGSLPKIEEALYQNNLIPESITHIILTHQDHDHVGAAAAFKAKYPNVQILASVEETPYISGQKKSLRLEQAEQMQQNLPEEMQDFGRAFCGLLRSVKPVQVDQQLSDCDVLPFCGGCQVLLTSGHTPGHISLYLPELRTIVTGDAIALEGDKPILANPQFTLDTVKAQQSMQRLLAFSDCRIICYHGGELK